MARGFDLAACANAGTAACPHRTEAAIHLGQAARQTDVGPQHHLAAVALGGGAGVDAGARLHAHGAGLAQVAAALPVAADQHGAATGGAIGADAAACAQANAVAGEGDLAALGAVAVHVDAAAVDDAGTCACGCA